MPRKPTIRQSQYPYHITSRSNMKNWFVVPPFHMDRNIMFSAPSSLSVLPGCGSYNLADVWNMSLRCLAYAQQKHCVVVHAYVLMCNHYHLLVSTPKENIDLSGWPKNTPSRISLRSFGP